MPRFCCIESDGMGWGGVGWGGARGVGASRGLDLRCCDSPCALRGVLDGFRIGKVLEGVLGLGRGGAGEMVGVAGVAVVGSLGRRVNGVENSPEEEGGWWGGRYSCIWMLMLGAEERTGLPSGFCGRGGSARAGFCGVANRRVYIEEGLCIKKRSDEASGVRGDGGVWS